MKKSERLNDMMLFLNQKAYFNLSDIMERYNISKSTAVRDIQSLEAIGMPIYAQHGRNGRYCMLSNRLFAPILFNMEEMYAIYFSMMTLQAFESTPFHLSVNHLKEKFEGCIPKNSLAKLNRMSEVLYFDTAKHHNSSPFLRQILLSALDEQVCKVQYEKQGRAEVYYVQFDEITTRFGQWYVVGYNFKKQHHQVFRCDRILAVSPTTDFKPIPLKQLSSQKETDFYKSSSRQFKVEIKPKAVDLFYKEQYPNMQLKEANGRFYIEGSYQPFELDFITSYLLAYGSMITSIEPDTLKVSLVLEAKKRVEYLTKL